MRSGARPGDFLYVTGTLGAAAAALNQLRDGKKLRPRSHPKHFYPEPRVAVGQFLREKKLASAMIDISDGLSTDLGHICDESGVGAVVYAEALPAAGATSQNRRFVSGHGFSRAERKSIMGGASAPASFELALHGGDEYELLFTARPNRRIPKQICRGGNHPHRRDPQRQADETGHCRRQDATSEACRMGTLRVENVCRSYGVALFFIAKTQGFFSAARWAAPETSAVVAEQESPARSDPGCPRFRGFRNLGLPRVSNLARPGSPTVSGFPFRD